MSQDSFYEAAVAILNALGAPRTPETVNGLVAWIVKEKGWWYNGGDAWQWNNPLNTTLACCNWIGNANYVGVKIYPTREDGIEATVRTMLSGYYHIVSALRAGDINSFLAAGEDFCYWVSGQRMSTCQYHQDIIWIYRHLPPPPDWTWKPSTPPGYLTDEERCIQTGGIWTGKECVFTPPPPLPITPLSFILVPITAALASLSGAGLLFMGYKGISISEAKDMLLRRIRHGK